MRGTAAERRVLEEVTLEAYSWQHRFREVGRRILAHIYYCQTNLARRYGRGGVPISFRLIKRACRKEESAPVPRRTKDVWLPLEEEGFLVVDSHIYREKGPGRSRRFHLPRSLRDRLSEAAEEGRDQKTRYNLVTGARVREKKKTSLTYDGSHSWKERSAFMHRALKALKGQRDLVNKEAVEAHLQRLKRLRDATEVAFEKAKSRFENVKSQVLAEGKSLTGGEKVALREARLRACRLWRDYDRARSRYAQDRRIWDGITGQGLSPATGQPEGIYEYETAYEVQLASGRLTMRCGLQSASEEMKAAASKGISGYRNLDIESSQTEALRQEMEEAVRRGANLDLSVLDRYPGKDQLADTYGIGRDRWKRPEHAVKFGAGFAQDTYEKALQAAKGQVLSRIGKDEGGTPRFGVLYHEPHETGEMAWERAVYNQLPTMAQVARDWAEDGEIEQGDPEAIYALLREVYGEMAEQIGRWREWLLNERWPKRSQPGGRHGKHVKNPCGLPFSIYAGRLEGRDGTVDPYDQKVAYATSRLQGLEAAFMHALAQIAEEYDYEFLRNEHDGAIVLGEVPEEARERAREMSGFRRARLEEKPFDGGEETGVLKTGAGGQVPSFPETSFSTDRLAPKVERAFEFALEAGASP